MTHDSSPSVSSRRVRLFASATFPCNYIPEQTAAHVFVDTQIRTDTALYSQLIERGFRRSGNFFYNPQCPSCDACVPVRVPADYFIPNRSQRRTWRRNQDLAVTIVPASYNAEHFELYCRYLNRRHQDAGMDNPAPNDFANFLYSDDIDTLVFEFREASRLLAVAVVDRVASGLSAVYTFYDPEVRARSLGTYAVLWQIHMAQKMRLPWIYLGYWIKECRKMSYKTDFRPLEMLRDQHWEPSP